MCGRRDHIVSNHARPRAEPPSRVACAKHGISPPRGPSGSLPEHEAARTRGDHRPRHNRDAGAVDRAEEHGRQLLPHIACVAPWPGRSPTRPPSCTARTSCGTWFDGNPTDYQNHMGTPADRPAQTTHRRLVRQRTTGANVMPATGPARCDDPGDAVLADARSIVVHAKWQLCEDQSWPAWPTCPGCRARPCSPATRRCRQGRLRPRSIRPRHRRPHRRPRLRHRHRHRHRDTPRATAPQRRTRHGTPVRPPRAAPRDRPAATACRTLARLRDHGGLAVPQRLSPRRRTRRGGRVGAGSTRIFACLGKRGFHECCLLLAGHPRSAGMHHRQVGTVGDRTAGRGSGTASPTAAQPPRAHPGRLLLLRPNVAARPVAHRCCHAMAPCGSRSGVLQNIEEPGT